MTISYMQAENCPRCGAVLDYYDTFSTTGKQCRSCGWSYEWYTGNVAEPKRYVDKHTGQTITVSIKHSNAISSGTTQEVS